jgi:hypothetical protein
MPKQFAVFLCLAAFGIAQLAGRDVTLTTKPHMVGRTLIIEGITDLPDQAVIEWELRHEQLFTRKDIPISHMATEGHTAVHGHRYAVSVDLSHWPPGSVEVWVAFQPRSYGTQQPARISQMYGASGEWIEGRNVTIHPAHMRRIEVIEHIRIEH